MPKWLVSVARSCGCRWSLSVFNTSVSADVRPKVTFVVKGSNLSIELGQGIGQQQLPAATVGKIILAGPILGRAATGSVLFRL